MDDFTPLNGFSNENVKDTQTTPFKKEASPEESLSENTAVNETAEAMPAEESTNEADAATSEGTVNGDALDDIQDEYEDSKGSETQSDHFDKVLEVQQQLLERIDALNNLFNARIMHTDHEEKIVDQMHEELQKYKEDMYAQLVRPILLDVIEIRDSIMRMAAAYLAKPEGEQSIPNKTFSDYAFDLQDILEKNNVEIYRSKTGDDFTPIKQRVIKKIAASEEALHGKIAESLSCGYSYSGKTISAEKVSVYFYEKPVQKNENSEVTENG